MADNDIILLASLTIKNAFADNVCSIALLVIIKLQNTTNHPHSTTKSATKDTYIMMYLLYTKYILHIIVVVIITYYIYKYIIH